MISSPALDAGARSHHRAVDNLESGPVRRAALNKLLIAANKSGTVCDEESAAAFLQVRSVSTDRFLIRQIGALGADEVEEIVAGVVIAIDYES